MSSRFNRREFAALALSGLVPARAARTASLTISCSPENDLYRVLREAGLHAVRYDAASDALKRAAHGSGVLLLSDQYPDQMLHLPSDLHAVAAGRNLRVYVEYAASAATAEPSMAHFERAVVTTDFFGPTLQPQRIVSLHSCKYVDLAAPSESAKVHLTLARVAGYDTAVFGLPATGTHPLLVEEGRVLNAATQLSRFVTARYAPFEAWLSIWRAILCWASSSATYADLKARRVVAPAWAPGVEVPASAEREASARGAQWYSNARLFVHPSWAKRVEEAAQFPDQVGPAPAQSLPVGDGSLGMLEGHDSHIFPDGSQNMRWWMRADCLGETAMTLSFAEKITRQTSQIQIAANLIDFLLTRSNMASGVHLDTKSPAYGLIGWNNTPKYYRGENGYEVYYGDDNARCLLGILATMSLSGETRWLERFWLALLADFRLVGKQGFQKSRYDGAPLAAEGWRHYFDSEIVLPDMNYQAYPWALFLWAGARTKWPLFQERVERGIRLTMEAYPDKWRWTESITSQQARLILPLAWLIRVSDTAEHRSWLKRIASDLLARQDRSGAIRECTGGSGTGIQKPPTTNEQYGTGEAPLIQNNGDPASDLLYTMNFAFIGMHEAYAATGDITYKDAENRIADFLVRAQVHSTVHPEFNGAWFRAFDFDKWDYWASSSDSGWGPWCTESGWSQSWITTTFALRQLKNTLWDIAQRAPEFDGFDRLRRTMFPNVV